MSWTSARKIIGSHDLKQVYRTFNSLKRSSSLQVLQFHSKPSTHNQSSHAFRSENQLSNGQNFYYKRFHNSPGSKCFVLGGIMAFFGLDEESKKDRQYDKEVENIKEEDFDEKLKNILRPAILNIQEGEFDKAEKIFHIALRMAQDVNHQDAILYIHDLLANLAFETNDFVKAEKLFIDVMQRQLSYKGVAKDDNSIIAMSLKLAIIFSKTEQHEKAQQGFEFCIDSTENKIKAGRRDDDTMALWGMSCDVYGQYLMTQGFHEKARDQFKKAYDISCDVNGDTDEQSLVLLNSLGTISATMGDNKASIDYFREAVDKARKNNSEHLPHYLVNQGMVQITLKLYDVAKRNCSEALQLSRKMEENEAYEQSQNCLKIIKETMKANK